MAQVAAVLVVVALGAANATADTLKLVVFSDTGHVWLYNSDAAPVDFIYYSVSSVSGALDGSNGVWTSIADTYDVNGDGSVDPFSEWFELNATALVLTEATFGAGGTLAPSQAVSLGAIWSPAAGQTDLDAEFVPASPATTLPLPIVFTLYDSDFDYDLDVDLDDLAIWRANFGTGTLHSQGDGDQDGDVDGDDFLLWQSDVIAAASIGTGGVSTLAAVPEPAAVWLLCAGGAGVLMMLRSTRSRNR